MKMIESVMQNSGGWLGLLGSIGLLLVGHVATKYVVPFLKVGKRQSYARFITAIADELTDDLRQKYPERVWLQHLDEAVDLLVSICETTPDIARRAISASASRK